MATHWDYQDDLHTEYNDETRIASEYEPGGTVHIQDRPYTDVENARADAGSTSEQYAANKSTIEVNLEADLAAMQAIKDTDNAVIRDNPAPYIKDIATAVRRLIKMELEDFEQAE